MVSIEGRLEPGAAFLQNAKVSLGAQHVLSLLLHAPLGSASDLGTMVGSERSGMYGRLNELKEAGLVDCLWMGWSRNGVQRWWVTDHGLEVVGAWGMTWHHEFPRCKLVERLPMVEWFYRAAGEVGAGLGGLRGFQWMGGVSFDAVVRSAGGWAVVLWSGVLENEKRVVRRLEKLGAELDVLGGAERRSWPSVICFVVADEWQRELVLRASRRFRLEDMVSVLCVADESWKPALRPGSGMGRIHKRVEIKDTGQWGWERRMMEGLFTLERGVLSGRVLDVVAEWPGASLKMVKTGVGMRDSREVQRACKALWEMGMVERGWEDGMYRYAIGGKGFHLLARRDKVVNVMSQFKKYMPGWMDRKNMKTHEQGVMELVGQFKEEGVPAAAGWRTWEHLGGNGGIAPDAMLYLRESPYGEGWHYVEYERSARGEARIFRKLRGYGSVRRQDAWPVVAVVWNDEVEGIFHDVGSERNVPLVTATLSRLSEYGAVGNDRCWQNYGEPVRLG